jgi:Type ISP C-terminal specificity domain/N-6 DNA Methylase
MWPNSPTFNPGAVVAVGESSHRELKTRPDYAVTVQNALVGFVELKAPGKGADPRKFKDPHDRDQWEKLRSLPNLMYTDGNTFSLWQDGELAAMVTLIGDVESSGKKLAAAPGLMALFEGFLRWNPIPPRSAKELARTVALLCRLLRDEVTEQIGLGSEALTSLAADWRKLLFPEATDERFADGYAQAVTFGLLMARAKKITLATGMGAVAEELSKTSTLIGAALQLLTGKETRQALKTALGTLTRVLDAVDWAKISKDRPETWLYFYEDFLEVYDNELRKQTGSYYTPPEVVGAMVSLVDEALRTPRFGLHTGLAAPSVTLVDPAVGTGTFMLGVLRRIAETVAADEGPGAVKGAVQDALRRLIAFEMQLGPFAVAQLRILAEIVDLSGSPPKVAPRMFVTNTLGNPYDDEEWIPALLAPIAKSRRDANKIKRDEPITVVLGNPPYKERAMGQGEWVEKASKNSKDPAPLMAWKPPKEWGIGAHTKKLYNLYVYFWRWATWKVYDHGPGNRAGIVCFITVAGFLDGPGFQKMRDYLRRTCDDIWVIDCSPEGHQPGVNTRIFQAVQQPVCIVLASRSAHSSGGTGVPATVRFRALQTGHREKKFEELKALRLGSKKWIECPSEWRAPFLPASTGAWASYPKLEDLFVYNGSGVQPKRTWVIAPDAESLLQRWQRLIAAPDDEKEHLFHATLRNGLPADRHIRSVVREPIPGFEANETPLIEEVGPCVPPVQYAYRSFHQQWIIPDGRVITQPNADLWRSRSDQQVYLTAPTDQSPTNGPALTFTGLVPDLHHYNGRGGRVFPLWNDNAGTTHNLRPKLTVVLSEKYVTAITAPDVVAYVAAVAAHPAFTKRFQDDLSTPGLRIPLTADGSLFDEAARVGRSVIWLHTFGERVADEKDERPQGPPRLPADKRPHIPTAGSIPTDPENMPDSIDYDAGKRRLLVGQGHVENVEPAVWLYEVSGKQVLLQWFSYRKKHRERPIIGDRRPPSPLGDIQPDHWLPEYTTELINLLNVLGLLVELEPKQAELLDKVCSGPLISGDELSAAGALELPPKPKKKAKKKKAGPGLFDTPAKQHAP